jgi:hypothetical protein
MTVKIQTLDNVHPLVIKRSFTVQELKDKIFEVKRINFSHLTYLYRNRGLFIKENYFKILKN